MQKTILCYGDSNTWGYVPCVLDYNASGIQRYGQNERWPGLLQKSLGEDYSVIAEGLNSRTTNIDYHLPPDRNGKTYLLPCLYSHAPIDLVILALGGNDFKAYFNRSANDIRNGLAELIDIIQASHYGHAFQEAPKVLILSQPVPLLIAEQFTDENGITIFKGAIKKAEELVGCYANLAKEKNCAFLDLSKDVRPSEVDGLHLSLDGHIKMAEIVTKKILTLF